jgi:hypothetical protein
MKTTKEQITREQYIKSKEDGIHHAYYSQFVTENTMHFVKDRIGLAKIRASKCKHFNDVVKMVGRRGWVWDFTPVNVALARQLGEGLSLSTHTCVGKAAARMLIAD